MSNTIDQYTLLTTEEEKREYAEKEKQKPLILKWIEKFRLCKTAEELSRTAASYCRSVLFQRNGISKAFFLWDYAFHHPEDAERCRTLIQYSENSEMSPYWLLYPLCHVYGAEMVQSLYQPVGWSKNTLQKRKRELRKYIESINHEEKHIIRAYFDRKTHFYCEEDATAKTYRYFATFEEFAKYRGGNLTEVDLSHDLTEHDLTGCHADSTTLFPPEHYKDCLYEVRKEYRKSYGKFYVLQAWYSAEGQTIKQYRHSFEDFEEFASFLNGDLSRADLLDYEALAERKDVKGLNLAGSIIRSEVCRKLGIPYEEKQIKEKAHTSRAALKNEKETETALVESGKRESLLPAGEFRGESGENATGAIHYITDIHLPHKLMQKKPRSEADILYETRILTEQIALEAKRILLIGGDVSDNYGLFRLFIKELRASLSRHYRKTEVYFVLGNHELWDFYGLTLPEIYDKYETLIEKYGMKLLKNGAVLIKRDGGRDYLTEEELLNGDANTLERKADEARIILYGGIGFAGCNNRQNADTGIYGPVIDRKTEIEESKKTETIHRRLVELFGNRSVAICTHMPMECWSKDEHHKGFIYVSGHTHRNIFYDDGEIRIYADNQSGYRYKPIHLKYFLAEGEYDHFYNIADGIHPITAEDYRKFYRGKNIYIEYNRKGEQLYMLKKDGFYCFLAKNGKGKLFILNGGQKKALPENSAEYYFDHMDDVIATIKSPLATYTRFQKKVAKEIRRIGGDGTIHGCIVDIDFYNHVYVNPIDSTVTGYWASSIVYKVVYPNIPQLLEEKCPAIYKKCLAVTSDDAKNMIITRNNKNELAKMPEVYLDTDMYRASREIKKMQRLHDNILTTWIEKNEVPTEHAGKIGERKMIGQKEQK